MKLIVSQYLQRVRQTKFLFDILAYISLGVFLLTLEHIMMRVQLIVSSQIIYLGCNLFGKPKVNFSTSFDNSYIVLFAARSIILIFLIFLASRNNFKLSSLLIIIFDSIYILIIIGKRPYRNKLQNVCVIIEEVNATLSLVFGYISQKIQINEFTQICIVVIIQTLLCICILITIIRVLIFHFKWFSTSLRQVKNRQDEQVVVRERKKNCKTQKYLCCYQRTRFMTIFRKVSQKKSKNPKVLMKNFEQMKPSDEPHELLLIKQRLYKNFWQVRKKKKQYLV